jgi:hypothetical protein
MTDDINATEQNPLTRQTSPESHQLSVAINYRAKESKHTKKKKKSQLYIKCLRSLTLAKPLPNTIAHKQAHTSFQI